MKYPLYLALLIATLPASALAEDWPMWRYDPGHTAASPEVLSESLHLQWILTFSQRPRVWDDPLNHDMMSYDRVFEPIVAGDQVFLSFSDKDKVVAFDLETGTENWTFYANAPIWFSPVAWEGYLYLVSDDGHLYCLDAATGDLHWKFRGAPSDRKALGNKRMISAWPARGGPVVRDGQLYFAASIWPFMGTFIYALDAKTGAITWVNDGSGSEFIKQPHAAPSFAGVAPQGTLVALDDYLLVPGGRSVPAALDRKTGELVHFNLDAGGKANGGSFVAGHQDKFFVHTRNRGVRAYDTKSGKKTGFTANEPVLVDDLIYTAMPHPRLKSKLDEAIKKREESLAAYKKAAKELESALANQAKSPDKEINNLNKAKTKADEAKKTLDALEEDAPNIKEAEETLAKANKAVIAASKKLDKARKDQKKPIDKKLTDNSLKTELDDRAKLAELTKLQDQWDLVGRDVRVIHAYDSKDKMTWEFEADGSGDIIKAGDRLYAAGNGEIVAIDKPGDSEHAKILWRTTIDGEVQRLIAANGKLLAVTLDGRIFCFGDEKSSHPLMPPKAGYASQDWPFSTNVDNKLARQVLALADVNEGYAMCFGVDDGRFLEALVEESQLHLIATDSDVKTVEGLRLKLDYQGHYGKRVVLQPGDPQSLQAPPYIASMVVLGKAFAERLNDPLTIKRIYESVRPYGGAIWFAKNPELAARIEALALPRAELMEGPAGSTFVFRQGSLPGASNWTHQYGNMSNTVKSDDKRVRLPLGILWFGGSPNTDVLPRHGHGPCEQVVGGRVIIEGMNRISARDVYTGRVLWKRDFQNLGTYGIYYDHTYTDDPLNPAYNQVHIPGANARGTNFVATEDKIYVAIGSACHVLDAATGQDVRIIEMPKNPETKTAPTWAYIGVMGDLVMAGNDFARFTSRFDLDDKKKKEQERLAKAASEEKTKAKDKPHQRKRKRKSTANAQEVPAIEDMSSSQGLVAYDRHTGDIRWQIDAEFSFLHNGIVEGDGLLFVLDKLPKSREEKMKRRGLAKPADYRLLALHAEDGTIAWEKRGGIFGTWLSYSKRHSMLFQAGAKARDRSGDEIGEGMIMYHGKTGDVVWENKKRIYEGPCILHNDLILTAAGQYKDSAGAFHILTGEPYLITNPITGKGEPWKITRAYGCNTPIAGEYLLTFRSGAAGYYDLDNMSGTGNFGGFRSGCTANLIPANGVLNAPDYTRTCSCGYQNQTSLAMVHMPDVELWTNTQLGANPEQDHAVEQVGINFGAPGDRRSKDGMLWLEYPNVGGASPDVQITVSGDKVDYFRRHSSQVTTDKNLKWVAASGVLNARKISIAPRMSFRASTDKERQTLHISKNRDDAEQDSNGRVKLVSTDLELTEDEGNAQWVGLQYHNLQLFPGETIANAYIEFTVNEVSKSEKTDQLSIHLEQSPTPQPFTKRHNNLSERSLIGKHTEWTPKEWKKVNDCGSAQHTPNIAQLLQELVNHPDWQLGSSVSILINGEGKRVAHSYDKDPKKAPRLIIETDGKWPRRLVEAKEDDAEEAQDGKVSLDSGDLELMRDQENQSVVGMRFRNLQIPRGTTIDSAFIQFTVDEPSEEATDLRIFVEDAANPPQFKNESGHLSARKPLPESISWSPTPWSTKGEATQAQRSPDISLLIQQIVNRDDWKPGQAVVFLIKGQGKRIANSFDGKKELAPKLAVKYQHIDLAEAPRYTVRLHFFDPEKLPPGQRLFHVALQGKRVLNEFDIGSEVTGNDRTVTKEFSNIAIPHDLDIEFERAGSREEAPILSGVELISEQSNDTPD